MHEFEPIMAQLLMDKVARRLHDGPGQLGAMQTAEYLRERLHPMIDASGHPPEDVLGFFETVLEPTFVATDNPRFLAFFQGAPSTAASLFDMVVTATAVRGVTWTGSSGAAAAENQVLSLLASLAGLPATAGGCFVSGGSAANLSALVAARELARRRRTDVGAAAQFVVAVSDQAHPSVHHALVIVDAHPLVVVPPARRLTGEAVAAAAAAAGLHVDMVIGTAGTPNSGTVDDLHSLAAFCASGDSWFHVDAAYGGGAALFAPSRRPLFRGIDSADSLVVDPHKWLFSPYDCSALIYRRPLAAREVHTQRAAYFDAVHADLDEWNPSDFAYHSTRRPRGLPLWFSLAVHGTSAYERAVEGTLRTTEAFVDLVESTAFLDLVERPDLSVVLVKRRGWALADYLKWSRHILRDEIGFVVHSIWSGSPVARFAILHPNTTIEILRDIVASMSGDAEGPQNGA